MQEYGVNRRFCPYTGERESEKNSLLRSSHPEVFLEKAVLKICSKFIGEHPCRSAISTKLLCSFIEIALWHG